VDFVRRVVRPGYHPDPDSSWEKGADLKKVKALIPDLKKGSGKNEKMSFKDI
jgi:hypothetical protein